MTGLIAYIILPTGRRLCIGDVDYRHHRLAADTGLYRVLWAIDHAPTWWRNPPDVSTYVRAARMIGPLLVGLPVLAERVNSDNSFLQFCKQYLTAVLDHPNDWVFIASV